MSSAAEKGEIVKTGRWKSILWPGRRKCIFNIEIVYMYKKEITLSVRKSTTVCLRSSDSFYMVSYYIRWVTTSWTYSEISGVLVNMLGQGSRLKIQN